MKNKSKISKIIYFIFLFHDMELVTNAIKLLLLIVRFRHLQQWSISPTFYEQLLRLFPCAEKKPKLKHRNAPHLTFVQKNWSKKRW
jgi:hypothetical protein